MSATDNKVEADENLKMALTRPDGYQHLRTEHLIALAQANATLYLAEQQRIANLIAFLAIASARGARDAAYYKLDQQVRETLGLS